MSKGQDPGLSLIERAEKHGQRTAIISEGDSFSYQRLLNDSATTASCLLEDHLDLDEARVAFLEPPGYTYAAVQWGIWRAGGIAVPLSISHPQPELEYVIQDSDAGIIVVHPCFEKRLRSIAKKYGCRLLLSAEAFEGQSGRLPGIDPDRRAMVLYTSGTTSKPKGVVTTHKNIESQVSSLVSAWEWRRDDHILGVLPLHHIHGIINVLTCALWSGAACEILPKFDPDAVWDCFLRGNLSLFMAVPTIYIKLISSWEKFSPERKKAISKACSRIRLMVSGSAALPVTTLMRWKDITGQVLLERYGMTETGMILSNPLHGARIPGYVGGPLPGIQVRLVDEEGEDVKPGIPGEILVKGPGVFREYWRNEKATERAFRDGWFLTGDIAVQENGIYRILGRASIDIIKTGGYKVSALEVEEILGTHPKILECSVVGVKDPEWGERVAVALITKSRSSLTLDSLRRWAKERLAPYKVPSQMMIFSDLPRNAMGKVMKTKVVQLFEDKN